MISLPVIAFAAAVLCWMPHDLVLAKRDKVGKISPLKSSSTSTTKRTPGVKKGHMKARTGSLNADDIHSFGLSQIDSISAQFFQDDQDEIVFRWKDSSGFEKNTQDDHVHWYGEADHGIGAINLIQSTVSEMDDHVSGLYGSANFGGQVYSIMVSVNGTVSVTSLDSSDIPVDDLDDDEPPLEARDLSLRGSFRHSTTSRQLDDGSVIDVMCVYTPKTVCYEAKLLGFTNSDSCDILTYKYLMDAKCQLAVAESNTAYTQSGVKTRLNLVYSGHLDPNYIEDASWSNNVNAILSRNNPMVAPMHQLRETYAADLVAVILNNGQYGGSSGSGGIFFVNQNYMTGYYSFSHEIGHNLGCRHDKGYYQAGSPSGYNFGYVDKVTGFRTIMAVDYSVPRVPYFSNADPTYTYKNVSIGSSSANCVAVMNSRVYTMANIRQSSTRIGNPVPNHTSMPVAKPSAKPVTPVAKPPTRKPSAKPRRKPTRKPSRKPVLSPVRKPTSKPTPKTSKLTGGDLSICSVNTGGSCLPSQVPLILLLDRPTVLSWSIINSVTNQTYCSGGPYSSSSISPLSYCLMSGQSLKLLLNDKGNVGFISSGSTYNATVGVPGSNTSLYFTKYNAMQPLAKWRGHVFQT